MARRDLHVPYEEKDEAKRLGARWDANIRRWYVPDGISADAFARWFEPRTATPPVAPDFSGLDLNLTIARPAIAEASVQCWSCRADTPVLTIAGRDQDDDLQGITGIKAVDPTTAAILAAHPYYRLAFSGTTRIWAFANVCACGALQGDFFLHNEPDGPFFALHSPENPSRITDLDGPIRVATDFEPYGDIGE